MRRAQALHPTTLSSRSEFSDALLICFLEMPNILAASSRTKLASSSLYLFLIRKPRPSKTCSIKRSSESSSSLMSAIHSALRSLSGAMRMSRSKPGSVMWTSWLHGIQRAASNTSRCQLRGPYLTRFMKSARVTGASVMMHSPFPKDRERTPMRKVAS